MSTQRNQNQDKLEEQIFIPFIIIIIIMQKVTNQGYCFIVSYETLELIVPLSNLEIQIKHT